MVYNQVESFDFPENCLSDLTMLRNVSCMVCSALSLSRHILKAKLYTIVSNHCLMLARSQKKNDFAVLENEEGLIDDRYISDWKYTPDKLTENNELRELLDEAIKKLPYDYRVVFLLRDVEGLSTVETGEIVNLSVPAVKSRLHRARAFLRNELDKILRV
jgi:RNA polymerase sigma-70 factor (ECF subfamily)